MNIPYYVEHSRETNIELKNNNRPRFMVFAQWKEELQMVDDRVRIVVAEKDQASIRARYCCCTSVLRDNPVKWISLPLS